MAVMDKGERQAKQRNETERRIGNEARPDKMFKDLAVLGPSDE